MKKHSRYKKRTNDTGAVTIEFAMGLITIVVIISAITTLLAGALTAIRCVDAARTATRLATVNETSQAITAAAKEIAGTETDVDITVSNKWVNVTVSAPVPYVPWPWTVSSTATGYKEDAI